MKKYFLALLTLTIIGVSCSKSKEANAVTTTTTKHTRTLMETNGWVNAHSEKRNCLKKNGNCAWALTDENLSAEGCNPVTITLLSDNELSIKYTVPVELEDGNFLPIENPFTVPSSISHRLGKSAINILPGTYEIKYETYANGERIVRVNSSN